MRDRPGGAELLVLARELLLRDLAPLLPEERREDVARIARSMAIAEQELRYGGAPLAECQATLAAHYGEGDLEALLRRLAIAIRAGGYDDPGPGREAVRALLWAITRQKLRESNPGFLADSDPAFFRAGRLL